MLHATQRDKHTHGHTTLARILWSKDNEFSLPFASGAISWDLLCAQVLVYKLYFLIVVAALGDIHPYCVYVCVCLHIRLAHISYVMVSKWRQWFQFHDNPAKGCHLQVLKCFAWRADWVIKVITEFLSANGAYE